MAAKGFFVADDLDEVRQGARKRVRSGGVDSTRSTKKRRVEEEELPDDEDFESSVSSEEEEEEEEDETAAERRLRIAKQYLDAARHAQEEELDDNELSRRLNDEAKEAAGRLMRPIADKIAVSLGDDGVQEVARVMRGHHLSPTCVCITEDGTSAFSGAKDCSIGHWDVETGKKVMIRGGRRYDTRKFCTGGVLAVAVNDAGNLLASGGRDNLVRVWDTRTNRQVKSFTGHKAAVTCLAFRKRTNQLFSGSMDRTLRVFSLDEMIYTESLYGHQDEVWGVASMANERAISCGGDMSCRLWKVAEEKQLLFQGHSASIDSISMFNEERWITGSQDGSVSTWNIGKKKPTFTQAQAHGPSSPWVTSVHALNYSDFAASGSHTGRINLWRLDSQKLARLGSVPVTGFVNGIDISKSGEIMVAAVGQEHRLGRWWRDSSARNSI